MIRKLLVLGLLIGAVTAPAALAKPVSSDVLNGGYDPWAVGLIYKSTQQSTPAIVPNAGFASAAHAGRTGGLAPWERSFFQRNAKAAAPVNLGPVDPWAYSLLHPTPPTRVVTANSSSGFDYGDAGIGAGVAFGGALILLTMVGIGLRTRRIDRSGLAAS